jgi:hypothetical protein
MRRCGGLWVSRKISFWNSARGVWRDGNNELISLGFRRRFFSVGSFVPLGLTGSYAGSSLPMREVLAWPVEFWAVFCNWAGEMPPAAAVVEVYRAHALTSTVLHAPCPTSLAFRAKSSALQTSGDGLGRLRLSMCSKLLGICRRRGSLSSFAADRANVNGGANKAVSGVTSV